VHSHATYPVKKVSGYVVFSVGGKMRRKRALKKMLESALRGGSYQDSASSLRFSFYIVDWHDGRSKFSGFRLVARKVR
jgi:hypothetical protein